MENNFVQAALDNLPSVDNEMMAEFFVRNNDYISAEIRGVKASRSSKHQYGDTAIGYVKLLRKANVCTVKSQITPEHKVRNKAYHVTAIIDEEKEEILFAACSSCVAAAGGCKHAIAFLFWLHRKSEEPAPTSVQCYWKCSALSKVTRSTTFMTTSDMSVKKPQSIPIINHFRDLVMDHGSLINANGILFESPPKYVENMSLYHLALSYKEITDKTNFSDTSFEVFCTSKMSDDFSKDVEIMTRTQRKSSLWEKIRFGRITASRIYEAANCRTYSGVLVESVMGAILPLKLEAVLRGQRLETQVLAVVAARMDVSYEMCGIFTNKLHPFYGASPDAINDEHIFEVKCPSKASTIKNYIKDKKLTEKPYSQMQLQMHFTGRKKGFFCVASPTFETDSEVEIVEVFYDQEYCDAIIMESRHFWNKAIFNLLIK